jgi:two-component system, NarL family, response regulator NreC
MSSHESPVAAIRLLIADDDTLVRGYLASRLAEEDDMEVVGQASDGQVAVELAMRLKPDVVLMDLSMPHCNGLAATKGIHSELPEVKILGLSMYDGRHLTTRLREAGADGFLSKSEPIEKLVRAIRDVVAS